MCGRFGFASVHRSTIDRLDGGNTGIRIAHLGPRDLTAFDDYLWFGAKVLGTVEDKIGKFADFYGTKEVRHAVHDRAVDVRRG